MTRGGDKARGTCTGVWVVAAAVIGLGGGCGPLTTPIEVVGETDTDRPPDQDSDDDTRPGDDTDTGEPTDTDTDAPDTDDAGVETGDTDDAGSTEDTDEPPVDHCGLDGAPALAIGHGGGAFSAFDDGPAQLVYGDQGGVHIDVALRAEHLDLSGIFISDIRATLDGAAVAVGNGGGGFACDADTLYLLRDGIRLIFELAPASIHEQTFAVTAELTDSADLVTMAYGEVLVVDPMQQ